MGKRAKTEQDGLEYMEYDVYKKIGFNIKKYMLSRYNSKHRRLTQEELAMEIEKNSGASCSRSTVNRWISAVRRPSIVDLKMLCEIFDCSLDALCDVKEQKRDNEAAERFTGLSQEAVQYLHRMDFYERKILDSILSSESGLDIILQNIREAQNAAAGVRPIQTRLDLAISGYRNAQTERHVSKMETGMEEPEEVIVPPENKYQLQNRRDNIRVQLNLLQLQEFKQEGNKRKIRTIVEQMLDKLIPPAKSKLFPDVERTRHEVLGE